MGLLGIAALPAPCKVDVILMACCDVQMGMHCHGCCRPSLEVRAMGGLGHMIQQPGSHMAQLMTQRALQLLRIVQHLCAQLHSGCVPVNQTTASDSANIQAESRQADRHGHHSCVNNHRQQPACSTMLWSQWLQMTSVRILTWEFHLPTSLCCNESGLLWSSDGHSN